MPGNYFTKHVFWVSGFKKKADRLGSWKAELFASLSAL
jgi:hypothetical protein